MSELDRMDADVWRRRCEELEAEIDRRGEIIAGLYDMLPRWSCRSFMSDDCAVCRARVIAKGTATSPPPLDDEMVEREEERFDAPGCQMCGAHPDDPCDCHDPQG